MATADSKAQEVQCTEREKRVPLDKKDVYRVKSSWNVIKERVPEAGLELFYLYVFGKRVFLHSYFLLIQNQLFMHDDAL